MAEMKKQTMSSVGKDMQQLEPSYTDRSYLLVGKVYKVRQWLSAVKKKKAS